MIRRIDENGELVTSGDMFAYNSEEVGINILTRLRMFLGESFRDTSDGTAWFQEILIKNYDISVISQTIQKRISETEGVKEILSLNAIQDPQSRTIDIQGQVLTIYGEVIDLGGVNVSI